MLTFIGESYGQVILPPALKFGERRGNFAKVLGRMMQK
jgi:hypothetical protein